MTIDNSSDCDSDRKELTEDANSDGSFFNRSNSDSGLEDAFESEKSLKDKSARKDSILFLYYPISDPARSANDNEEEINFLIDEDRVAAIRQLIESYLSDLYLTKDIFLLKHFRKNKERWISVKLMTTYKRLKRLVTNVEEVVQAVKSSSFLELHPDGTKLRRKNPISSTIEHHIPTRMTFIAGLCKHVQSIPSLAKVASRYGTVLSLHVIKPRGIFPEKVNQIIEQRPELSEMWCGLVEFELIDSCVNFTDDFMDASWCKELVIPWKNRSRNNSTSDCNSPLLSPAICSNPPSRSCSSSPEPYSPTLSPRMIKTTLSAPNSPRFLKTCFCGNCIKCNHETINACSLNNINDIIYHFNCINQSLNDTACNNNYKDVIRIKIPSTPDKTHRKFGFGNNHSPKKSASSLSTNWRERN